MEPTSLSDRRGRKPTAGVSLCRGFERHGGCLAGCPYEHVGINWRGSRSCVRWGDNRGRP